MVNLEKARKIYMIGIKGVGMTMLAQFLKNSGVEISGSDTVETFMTDRVLRRLKIPVAAPFSASNIPPDADLIVYSLAFNADNNPEMAIIENNAQLKKIKKISYSEAIGQVFNQYQGIAVCGSHGKTTTAAWLGYVLAQAGKAPNVLVGAPVPQFKGSALSGRSKYFIAEADEYYNKLRFFTPHGVVLNNIEYDHPDFFPTEAMYRKVFADFIKKIPSQGFLIINNQDLNIKKIKKNCRSRVITYDLASDGVAPETVNYLAYNLRLKNGRQIFSVNNFGDFQILLWGEHNILNALAVIAAARELGVPMKEIKKHLLTFKGTERRAQILGRYNSTLIIDDYAHHPTEIRATLSGLKAHFPDRKLRAVFHPHTFTRTKALFTDFVSSFAGVDELIILDIYGSAREKQGGVSSAQLVKAVIAYNKKNKITQKVKYIPDIKKATAYCRAHLKPNEVLLLLGAGDVFRLGRELLKK